LALELAARHFGERGESTQAEAYLREAILAYERWGAHAKVEHLRHMQGISTSNELQLHNEIVKLSMSAADELAYRGPPAS
jgi:hypothetical protein